MATQAKIHVAVCDRGGCRIEGSKLNVVDPRVLAEQPTLGADSELGELKEVRTSRGEETARLWVTKKGVVTIQWRSADRERWVNAQQYKLKAAARKKKT